MSQVVQSWHRNGKAHLRLVLKNQKISKLTGQCRPSLLFMIVVKYEESQVEDVKILKCVSCEMFTCMMTPTMHWQDMTKTAMEHSSVVTRTPYLPYIVDILGKYLVSKATLEIPGHSHWVKQSVTRHPWCHKDVINHHFKSLRCKAKALSKHRNIENLIFRNYRTFRPCYSQNFSKFNLQIIDWSLKLCPT